MYFLRAAAFRSRQKRKRWVTNLEAKTTVMNTANKLLQNEVLALRSEVAQLKLQLLAHKDCPVTLAMCQQPLVSGDGINLFKFSKKISQELPADSFVF